MSYQRVLTPPKQSFFLFGPRGTGKSTWLRDVFKPQLRIDLLSSREFLSFSSDPSLLRSRALALPKKSKIVIDEIQKCPELLDEVHALIFDYPDHFQFALTGSSARNLKKKKANLLAGRVIQKSFFPLTHAEMGNDFELQRVLEFGSLPQALNLSTQEEKAEFLYSYVETYLKEEIQEEAAVRNIPKYHRFLKHAAIMNGQVLNLNTISREAAVARATLDGYFSIVEETLLGSFVEPLHLKAKVKEVSTPKFYFFDSGVVRAIRNEIGEKLEADKGALLETFVLNELRAYSSYHSKHWEINYWGTPSGGEVDFIVSKGKKRLAIEIKSSKSWQSSFDRSLNELLTAKKVDRAIGVYLGKDALKRGSLDIFPLEQFCKHLNDGEFLD